jgi:hypothetical protein
LATKSSGLTDVELREALNAERSALGGILGGISRKAEANGLSPQDIYVKEDEDGSFRYRLTDTMREFMESKEPARRAYREIPKEKDAENT